MKAYFYLNLITGVTRIVFKTPSEPTFWLDLVMGHALMQGAPVMDNFTLVCVLEPNSYGVGK